jgi:hypothetical protein
MEWTVTIDGRDDFGEVQREPRTHRDQRPLLTETNNVERGLRTADSFDNGRGRDHA